MDILSRISSWGPDHQQALLRVRDYAVTTITEPPFKDPTEVPHSKTTITGESHICTACTQILEVVTEMLHKALKQGRMAPNHVAMNYTLFDLHISAQLGCHMCSILEASTLRYIKGGKPTALEFDGETEQDSWLWLTTNASRMDEARCDAKVGFCNAEVSNEASNELSFFLRRDAAIKVDGKATSNSTSNSTSHSIVANTSGEGTFQIVNDWLHTCRETHERCKNVRPPEPHVPRRLLQIEDRSVRVVENTGLEYVCLSHCWGSQANVPHKLIEGAQYAPFAIADLPKTFRNAINITRKLGIRHIWIDCFCIVQGSKQDWLEQSAVMAQVYAHSAFTIAALAASNTHGGCFQDRNHLALKTLHTKEVTLEPRIKEALWNLEVEGDRPESSPLHTRAWVVQERLSSPRTVFYGKLGVYWECRCMQASESHVKTIEDVTNNFKTLLGNLENAAIQSANTDNAQIQARFLDRWGRLLDVYTVCSLTYFSDKLIAISGITRDIEKYSQKQYVQGLWQDALCTGLLWIHVYDTAGLSSLREDRSGRVKDADTNFPTWSWASMLGRIQYFQAPGKVIWSPTIAIESSAGVDSDSSPSRIRLRTHMRVVELSIDDDDHIVLRDDGSRHGDLDEEYLWYSDEKVAEQVPMHILLIEHVSISEKPFLHAVRCLVVTCVDGNRFRRLGMVNIRFGAMKYDPFPKLELELGMEEVVLV